MNGTRVWVLLGIMLVVGLLAGVGIAALMRPSDPARIDNAELRVGEVAPDFRLADQSGGYVRLSDFRGQKNLVIAFYPLAWTPV